MCNINIQLFCNEINWVNSSCVIETNTLTEEEVLTSINWKIVLAP